jgi:tight adherence protein C
MIGLIAQKLSDPQFLVAILAAVAVAATVLTLAMPVLTGDNLDKRMKTVAVERDRIRSRERDRMATSQQKQSLRQTPKAFMLQIVDRFKLRDWLSTENARAELARAGYRGAQAEIAFLVFRLVMPIGLFLFALIYVFLIDNFGQTLTMRIGIAVGAAYLGIKAPEIFLSSQTSKRQLSMRQAFPDALDLMLICVEAGMSIEHAFRKVSQEIGTQSIPLAEELALTTAELSYLPERRQAYENFSKRTGLESVKSVTTALVQAERYGTPLGTALRTLAQESRDQRMNLAETKAAALPPKLTVPMILFFLPVLFAVIMVPALVGVFNWK